jgi:hypothetical protein
MPRMDLARHLSPERSHPVPELPAGTALGPALFTLALNKLDLCSGLQREGVVAVGALAPSEPCEALPAPVLAIQAVKVAWG